MTFQLMHYYTCIDLLGLTQHLTFNLKWTKYLYSVPVLLGCWPWKSPTRTTYWMKVTCHMRDMNYRVALDEKLCIAHIKIPIFSKFMHRNKCFIFICKSFSFILSFSSLWSKRRPLFYRIIIRDFVFWDLCLVQYKVQHFITRARNSKKEKKKKDGPRKVMRAAKEDGDSIWFELWWFFRL